MVETTVRIEKSRYRVQTETEAESVLVTAEFLGRLTNAQGWGMGFGEHEMTFYPSEKSSDALQFGSGISGAPRYRIWLEQQEQVYLSVLIQDLVHLLETQGENPELPFACKIEAGQAEMEVGFSHKNGHPQSYETESADKVTLYGFGFRVPAHIPREDSHQRALCEVISTFPFGGGTAAWLALSDGYRVVQPEPESMLQNPQIQIYIPSRTGDAADFHL